MSEVVVLESPESITVTIRGKRVRAEISPLIAGFGELDLPSGKWWFFNRLINETGEKGLGGVVLDELLKYCQDKGYSILNTVNAYGGMPQKVLENWYISKGFKAFDHKRFKNTLLIWVPKEMTKMG